MHELSLDFETRSTEDLRRTGVYPYAEHKHTGIWCAAYAVDDGDVLLWTPDRPIPDLWLQAAAEGWAFRAWNAQFERVIWNYLGVPRLGFPPVPLEQWYCTAAEAAVMAMPRSLGACAEVLKVPMQKDTQGHNLMMRMARPRHMLPGGIPVWWTDPDRLARLYEYCRQDVRVERALHKSLRVLERGEREVYLLDQKINDRGVLLDTVLVEAARDVAEDGINRANALVADLTDGAVSGVSKVANLTRWLNYEGVATDNVAKSTVRDLLLHDGIGGRARQVLEIRAEAARSSVAKLDTMMRARCADDRVRGMLLYHGASTGRWAGVLVQPQNFPRGEVDAEALIPLVLDRAYDAIDLMHPPLVVVSSLLRGCFVAPPAHELYVADFSAIEARVLAWLAGQDSLLQLFRSGGKVYEHMASKIVRRPVETVDPGAERQMGKAAVLGCGFGMGAKKFQTTAYSQYGLTLSADEAKHIVDVYRQENPEIVRYWSALHGAALRAVQFDGDRIAVGLGAAEVRFLVAAKYLWVRLPSGRLLCYALPRIEPRETPWGDIRPTVAVWGTNGYTRKWEKYALYGGLLAENITQAVARDLLASAMLRLERAGLPVILSVHDEVLCEVPLATPRFDEFMALMQENPEWSRGCPIDAKGWHGPRYRKD